MNNVAQVLNAAITQGRSAVLWPASRGAFRPLPIRVVADRRGGAEHGIWAEVLQPDIRLIGGLIESATAVKVRFALKEGSMSLETLVLDQQRTLLRGQRILLGWPEQVHIRERRNSRREYVPEAIELSARLRIEHDGDREIPVRLFDLSAKGASVHWPSRLAPPSLRIGQGIRIFLCYRDVDYRLDGVYRNILMMPGGRIRLGVEFIGGEGAAQAQLHLLLEELATRRIRRNLGSALG